MCGIAGIVEFCNGASVTEQAVRTMCDQLVHRGPDDTGLAVQGPVGLGMRRLAVIDPAGGQQPLWNEERNVCVVFNGEIYNHVELRQWLSARGHRLHSGSDGEVIAHLYEEYGTDFPQRLNGMFAIALYDARRQTVLLIRDRLGIKPLYYSLDVQRLLFASEVKALLATRRIPRELDLDALAQFMSWEYVPGSRTLLAGVRKLGPGEWLEVRVDEGTVRRAVWWDVPEVEGEACTQPGPRCAGEWAEEVDAKLAQAVQRQLVSDVPLGAFLSGGVDSSLIVSHMPQARTFSIGFDDPSYNELPWARQVANHLGVEHIDRTLRPSAVDLFDKLMHFMDDPIGDFSIFPTFLVSQVAREHVTVALSGDGGDELFGGYESYVAQQTAQLYARIPRPLRRRLLEPAILACSPTTQKKGLVNKALRFVEGMGNDAQLAHARWRQFVSRPLHTELFTPEARNAMRDDPGEHILRLNQAAHSRRDLERNLYVDLKSYLCDNCLVKVDRMSMACSLEVRVPFLDHELVELAFRIPSHLKVRWGRTKVLLKQIAARRLPARCVYRRKEGFSIPMKHWLNTTFRPLVDESLSRERLIAGGLFQPATVQRLVSEHRLGRANHSHVLWSLLVFQDWRQRWAV